MYTADLKQTAKEGCRQVNTTTKLKDNGKTHMNGKLEKSGKTDGTLKTLIANRR